MVEHRETGPRPLLLQKPARPGVDRRGRRRLWHRSHHAERGRQSDEPWPVQVEGLRDVRANVVASAVTRYAEHRVSAGVLEAAQFLLEHHAVAVTA